jgi:hypothetical protein
MNLLPKLQSGDMDILDCETYCLTSLSLVGWVRLCDCSHAAPGVHVKDYSSVIWIVIIVSFLFGFQELALLVLAELVSRFALILLGIIQALVWLSQRITWFGKWLLKIALLLRRIRLQALLLVVRRLRGILHYFMHTMHPTRPPRPPVETWHDDGSV